MKRNNVHSVSDDVLMNQLGLATKLTISRALLLQLRDAGRAAMDRFLVSERDNIGRCSSVDLKAVVNAESARV
jgi:NTE family protein